MSKLEGLQFLKANAIEGKACDLSRPFAFISYAHDEEDTKIVRNVFQKLTERGYNLWIDTANMPKDENSWKDAAQKALMNKEKTCRLALFFRSEESLIRKTILDELEIIKFTTHIRRIITIDIWHRDDMTAKKFGWQLIEDGRGDELQIYKEICEYVKADNNAYRGQDVGHSLEQLVDELAKELKKDGVMPFFPDSDPHRPEIVRPASGGSDNVRVDSQTVKKGKNVSGPDPKPPQPPMPSEGYTYTIFGRQYFAGKREQGKLMYDVFAALTDKHPDKAEALTKRTSVARAENVSKPNTSEAYPTYFRICRKFTVEGRDYYVGISYGFKAKLAEIKGMLNICGEKEDVFVLMNQGAADGSDEGGPVVSGGGSQGTDGLETPVENCFEYEIWGVLYRDKSLANMMHHSFDILVERYPHKVENMADSDSVSAVARKRDVDEKLLPEGKMNYFEQKREHTVNGNVYYVSNRYNRPQGIGQIKKMFEVCEGNSYSFKIAREPEKKSKGISTDKKDGLGSLL